jgi:hypothetical protein
MYENYFVPCFSASVPIVITYHSSLKREKRHTANINTLGSSKTSFKIWPCFAVREDPLKYVYG